MLLTWFLWAFCITPLGKRKPEHLFSLHMVEANSAFDVYFHLNSFLWLHLMLFVSPTSASFSLFFNNRLTVMEIIQELTLNWNQPGIETPNSALIRSSCVLLMKLLTYKISRFYKLSNCSSIPQIPCEYFTPTYYLQLLWVICIFICEIWA